MFGCCRCEYCQPNAMRKARRRLQPEQARQPAVEPNGGKPVEPVVGQFDQLRPDLGGGGDCRGGQRRIAGGCPRCSVRKYGERRIPRWRRLGQPKKLWMQISLARSGGRMAWQCQYYL